MMRQNNIRATALGRQIPLLTTGPCRGTFQGMPLLSVLSPIALKSVEDPAPLRAISEFGG
jgi:hypothetical protein